MTAGTEAQVRGLLNATITLIAVVLPIAAQTNITGTVTLASGHHLDLDTGATSVTGGDLLWLQTGQLNPVGNALIAYLAGAVTASNFSSVTLAQLMGYTYNTDSALGPAFAVHTNGGNYSAVLITGSAQDSSTITLQFITFTSPTISQVLNNYSQIGSGFSNSGIAVGSLFIVKGGSLATATSVSALESSAPPGLPTALNGASVSVTVNGTTVTPAFYYAINTQLALVMPSSTPPGAGTITVTCNGQTSPPFNIQVVANALGFAGYYGYGTGLGIATDPDSGAFYNYTNSILPGTTVILWGSGLGADAARDTTFVAPVGGFPINALAALYVGGVSANVGYQGASGYPGVNQLNVTIPSNAPTGCHVPVVGVNSAGVPTNFITLPIGTSVCQEPEWGRDGTLLSTLAAQTTVNTGSIALNLPLDANGNIQSNVGINMPVSFYSYTGAGFGAAPGVVSSGGCIADSTLYSSAANGIQIPNMFVNPTDIRITPTRAGTQIYNLPPGLVGPGQSASIQVVGSAQVGSFTANATLPSPTLNWTNQAAAAEIARASGLAVKWTGGQPGTYVNISGTAGAGIFTCIAPVSANQFTVPSYIFTALPGGTATISVANQTIPQTFQAAQIDYGYTQGSDSQTVNATLQ